MFRATKRFLQMSLLTWFVIFSISCVGAFLFARFIRTSQVEANAIRGLEDLGFVVNFKYEHNDNSPPGADWFKTIFGEMVLARIESIKLVRGNVKSLDSGGDLLNRLTHLKSLSVESDVLENIDLKHVNLTNAEFWNCKAIEKITVRHDCKLSRLWVYNCDALKSIDLPESLTYLFLNSESLRKIKKQALPKLNFVAILSTDLISFDPLFESAEEIILSGCNGITNLDFSYPNPKLKTLVAMHCQGLVSIHSIPECVERLDLRDCESLRTVKPKDRLPNLGTFSLTDCPNVLEAPSMPVQNTAEKKPELAEP